MTSGEVGCGLGRLESSVTPVAAGYPLIWNVVLAVACTVSGAVSVVTSTTTTWLPTAAVPSITNVLAGLHAVGVPPSSVNRYLYVAPGSVEPEPAAVKVTGVP